MDDKKMEKKKQWFKWVKFEYKKGQKGRQPTFMGATLNVIKGSRQHNDYSRWWNQDWGRKEDDYPLTGVWKPSRLFTLQPFTLEPPFEHL